MLRKQVTLFSNCGRHFDAVFSKPQRSRLFTVVTWALLDATQ